MRARLPRTVLTGALTFAVAGLLAAAVPTAYATTEPATEPAADCQLDPAVPKRQFRAMWIASVVNIDWPSRPGLDVETQKAEFRSWLDLAQQRNMNAVIVQVRPTADAFWPSPHEPWSEWLTGVRGQDPGYDPLAYVVDEAHKRNLEFHAWLNPYRVSMPAVSGGAGTDINQLAPNHPVRQHPEWAVPYPVGHASARLYYNPGIPEVRQHVQTAMMDAVTKYDVDGVHFDDYFYPYPVGTFQFDDAATYARYGAGFDNIHDWRRNNIDLLIQEFGAKVRAAKPWVKFGVSPFGIWRNKATDPLGSETNGLQSYDAIYADTRKWVKEQWIDYIVPQVYWYIGFAVADYAKLVPWWADVVAGTRVHLYIGQPVYRMGAAGQAPPYFNPDEMANHLTLNRQYPQVRGDVHFSAKDVLADRGGNISRMAAAHYSRPALIPTAPHLGGKAPLFPVITRAQRLPTGEVQIGWRDTAPPVGPFGAPVSYAVWRVDGTTLPDACHFADARNLLTTVRGTADRTEMFTDRTAEPGKAYTYFVTSLDRLYTESRPSPPRFVF